MEKGSNWIFDNNSGTEGLFWINKMVMFKYIFLHKLKLCIFQDHLKGRIKFSIKSLEPGGNLEPNGNIQAIYIGWFLNLKNLKTKPTYVVTIISKIVRLLSRCYMYILLSVKRNALKLIQKRPWDTLMNPLIRQC